MLATLKTIARSSPRSVRGWKLRPWAQDAEIRARSARPSVSEPGEKASRGFAA
jgi:hypothetical protein